MTVICSWRGAEELVVVCDKRVIADDECVTDLYKKYTTLGERLLVAVAGELGPAHVWLRAARKARCRTTEALMSEFVPGEYLAIVYDRYEHSLYVAYSDGSLLQPAGDVVAIGAAAGFVYGYVAAYGQLDGLEQAQHVLTTAVHAASRTHLSVSSECDVLVMQRAQRAARTGRALNRTQRPRSDRRAA